MPDNNHPGASDHPWEKIFAKEGRVFTEQLPALKEAAGRFSAHRCQRILDLGCGNGRHVIAFADLGFEVLGADISRTGLKLTSQWLTEKGLEAALIQADTRLPLPFRSDCLDGVFSTQVIHHALLREVQLAISEIYRVLRPGGLAFITVPRASRSQRKSQKIELHTYLPFEGGEAGLPHHIFSRSRLQKAFAAFQNQEISLRDSGRLLAIWAEKPG